MIQLIKTKTLVRVYKRIKNHRDPKKIWLKCDFNTTSKYIERYFDTLVEMNFLEELDTVYKCGRNNKVKRSVKGWRIKQ